jgi:hypothetical protein
MRIKSLFYKKILCGKCGSNFKLKREKGTKRYVCSFYDNGKGCKRNAIDETMLVSLVNKRYGRELSEEEIREVVVEVIIKNEIHFDIILSEGVPISFHEHGIVF